MTRTLSLVTVSLVLALATTMPARSDSRVRAVMYQENAVVRIDTNLRFITSVEFAAGEMVRAVLAGDSASFEIVRLKSGNVISIKPLVRRARTNINVYTDRRAYVLDVREGRRRRLTHRVRFDYPKVPTRAELIAQGVIAGPMIARDYSAAGTADFRPVEAWDDGTATYFRFARTSRRPAIFWTDETGADHATNTTQIDADTVRIGLVRPNWTLRIGEEVICVVKGPLTDQLIAAMVAPEAMSWRTPRDKETDNDR